MSSLDYVGTRDLVPTARQRAHDERPGIDSEDLGHGPADTGSPEPPARRSRIRAYLASINPAGVEGPKTPLVVLSLSAALGGWSSQALGLAAPEIQASFGASVTMLTLVSTITSTVLLALGLPLGYLVDRVNRVWLVRLSALLAPLGDAIQATTSNFGIFTLGNTFGEVARTPAAGADLPLMSDYYRARSRTRVYGFLALAGTLGGLVSAPIVGYLVQFHDEPSSGLAQAETEALGEHGVPAADVVRGAATAVDYLGLVATQDSPVLKRPEVRQALSLVLDRRKLAALAGVGAAPATGFFPPSLRIEPGSGPGEPGSGPGESGIALPTCEHAASPTPRIEEAKALLARAGIDVRGQMIPLEYDDSPAGHAVGLEIQRQWESALGVSVAAIAGEWSFMSRNADSFSGFIGAFLMTWSTDAVTPRPGAPVLETYLRQIFTSPTALTSNWAKWSDRGFDAQVNERLAGTSDQRSRERIVAQLGAHLCAALPYLPLTQTSEPWLVRSQAIAGARSVLTGVDGLPLLRELYLRRR